MKWSWRIGRVFGIDLFVHATFPLLFVWIALSELGGGASAAAIAVTLVLTLAVFAIVVLHECGHALTARRFGIHTRDILLLPIGGIARLERMPRDPKQELLIALAGPAVNIGLAALLFAMVAAAGERATVADVALSATAIGWRSIVAQLIAINIWLAGFNLLPAFPMDGGRVLRALLAMRMRDYARATAAAARIGRGFALLFALAGIFWLKSPTLALVAIFVWIAATSEAASAQTSALLDHVPLASVMVTDFRTVAPQDTLAHAAQLTIDGFQQDFPVTADGALVGMLTRRDLVRGLAEHGSAAPIASAMQRTFPTAMVDEPADAVLARVVETRASTMPVLRGPDLVGVVTAENVSEYITLRAAQNGRARR